MSDRRIILAGGTGFLGSALCHDLVMQDYELIVLTRTPDASASIRQVHWDGRTLGPWARDLEGALAVVNLAGKSVNCRYTEENRRLIRSSRVDSVNAIGQAIAQCENPPKVLIQAATLAIYGDAGERVCDESTPPPHGFSPDTAVLWEEAFNRIPTPRTRKVLLRIGFVLGREGGALQTLARLTRWFLGGRAGSGQQWISWLHIQDLCRVVRFAIERADVEGVFNVCTPFPVRNKEFMKELRHALHRPWSPPVPKWAVKIGSWLMRTEAELALTGRRCVPKRLIEAGFEFKFPQLRPALEDLYGQPAPASTLSAT